MAHDAPQAAGPSKLVIRNIGLLLSGALEKPILDADTVVAVNGKISAIGRAGDVDTAGATTIVDAMGTTVAPGLIETKRDGAEPKHHATRTNVLGRRGTPEEVADAVRLLAGPSMRYVTGQTLHVNGGALMV